MSWVTASTFLQARACGRATLRQGGGHGYAGRARVSNWGGGDTRVLPSLGCSKKVGHFVRAVPVLLSLCNLFSAINSFPPSIEGCAFRKLNLV